MQKDFSEYSKGNKLLNIRKKNLKKFTVNKQKLQIPVFENEVGHILCIYYFTLQIIFLI